MKYLTFNNILLSFWFGLILLIIYGSARGLEYTFAPYFVFLSLLIICRNKSLLWSNKLLKVIIGFIIISVISSINWIYFPTISKYSYFQYLNYSVCAFIATLSSYSFTLKSNETEFNYLKICSFVVFCIGVIRFFHSYLLTISVSSYDQSNAFYYVLMPLPLIFLLNKHKVNTTCLIICIILCILSAKRSALISVILISLIFLLNSYKTYSKKNFFFFILIVIIIGSYTIKNGDFFERFMRLIDRMNQIADDGGSGRISIISKFIDEDIKYLTHFPELLIGNGFESYSIYHNRLLAAAHNDFLEVFFSYGVLGLFLLISFYILLYKRLLWSFKYVDRIYIMPCCIAFILFIVYGLLANNFYFYFNSLPLFLYLGVSEAIFLKNNN